jgi:ankyrin repeat protein
MSPRLLVGLSALILVSGASFANEQLRTAIESDALLTLKKLIAEGADVNDIDSQGATALHWAAYADNTQAALALLDAGAVAAVETRFGVTPLYLAALNGNPTLVSALTEAGADAAGTGPNGETLLMTATRSGVPAVIEALLDAGAQVDVTDPTFAQTALMIAVREDHRAVVDLLLAHGANVNARTLAGPTPEFIPPCKGTGCGSEGVGINRGGLPERGRRDAARGGMTPLLYAARDGQADIAAQLVAAGADLELAEANGIRPLLMSLLNGHLAVARVLVNAGAEPNADDFWGRTPLWAAIEYRNLDMNNNETDDPQDNGVDREPFLPFIEYLLDHGANPNARTLEVPPPRRWLYSLNDVSWVDFTGQTPFLRAALSGDTQAMRVLLEYGADPNIATQAGTTPLMAAAGVNWVVAQTYTVSPEALLEAVALCLELGADINATNSMGLSALLGAVNRGSNDIIEYLAEQGADLHVVDVQGRSALRWAEGVFLAAVGAEQKPATIALLEQLMAAETAGAQSQD